jgi:hypothetical protein
MILEDRKEAEHRYEGALLRRALRKELADPVFRTANDGFRSSHHHGSLKQFRMGDQQVDHGICSHIVVSVEPKFCEDRVFTNKVSDGVLKDGDNLLKKLAVRLGFHVFNDVELDA